MSKLEQPERRQCSCSPTCPHEPPPGYQTCEVNRARALRFYWQNREYCIQRQARYRERERSQRQAKKVPPLG